VNFKKNKKSKKWLPDNCAKRQLRKKKIAQKRKSRIRTIAQKENCANGQLRQWTIAQKNNCTKRQLRKSIFAQSDNCEIKQSQFVKKFSFTQMSR
jgi:hypothetical protein